MKNKKNVFISHSTDDSDTAKLLAGLFNKIFSDVQIWFSSDDAPGGGSKIGKEWFEEIFQNINICDIFLILVTPNSIDRSWIYFESGFARGIKKKIVPLCIQAKKQNLKTSLSRYKAYQLTDKVDFDKFIKDLIIEIGIQCDDNIVAREVNNLIPKLSAIKFNNLKKDESNVYELIENLRVDLNEKLSIRSTTKRIPIFSAYSVRFTINQKDKNKKQIFRDFLIEIKEKDTFQTITDNLFFNIKDLVKPFTYLEQWIIVDSKNNNHIIVREIASKIPAHYLLKNNTTYKIKLITKPYIATDSKDRM